MQAKGPLTPALLLPVPDVSGDAPTVGPVVLGDAIRIGRAMLHLAGVHAPVVDASLVVLALVVRHALRLQRGRGHCRASETDVIKRVNDQHT